MQRRPSVVYIRRGCVRRRALRCTVVFILSCILLLCLGAKLFWALLLGGIAVLAFRVALLWKW